MEHLETLQHRDTEKFETVEVLERLTHKTSKEIDRRAGTPPNG